MLTYLLPEKGNKQERKIKTIGNGADHEQNEEETFKLIEKLMMQPTNGMTVSLLGKKPL